MTPIAMSLVLAALSADPQIEWIAHRGESADAPENTLAAFRLAWERKASAIELDVHLTKDNRLAVCHDADTKRTTGAFKQIKSSTLAELQTLDAGRWKGPQFAGERIPALEDCLATIPEGGRCFVEVKVGPEAAPALVKAVRECGKKPEQIAVISFHAETIAEVKRLLPELKAYYLSNFKRSMLGRWTPTIDELIDRAREIRADGLDLAFEGPLDEAAARRMRDAGLGLYVWTVDEPVDARRMLKLGVDGITTNRTAFLRNALAK